MSIELMGIILMDFFFKPSGIALIGATANKRKGGYAILTNLVRGFKGGIYPVNPRYPEIDGLVCYPSIQQVPDPVDLAIIYVPASRIPFVIGECAERGIKGVMIQSAGFAETGEEGEKLQDKVRQLAADAGIRIWGPNCMGLVDVRNKNIFSFVAPTIWDDGMIEGSVSLVVQSGMLAAGFLIDIFSHGTMGFSNACSIGTKMDVDECDVLEYLIKDPDTAAIGLYLESIPEGRRFVQLCRDSEKPIVVLKGGKSERGAEAAMSHTASLAGDGAVVSGALAQAGVIEALDFTQMMDLCRVLSMFPRLPRACQGRVVVLTNSGGIGIVSSDFIHQLGLEMADLSEETRNALKTVFPEWMPPANPVDLFPAVERNGSKMVYQTVFSAVCRDPNVDAILFQCFVGITGRVPDFSALADIARRTKKPVFSWVLGRRKEVREYIIHVQSLGIPAFRELYRTVECMAAMFKHKSNLEHKVRLLKESPETDMDMSLDLDKMLIDAEGLIDEHESKQILSAAGIPVVNETLVTSKGEAAEAALHYGYPVVLKGLPPGEIHKTELGLVQLGISSQETLDAAFVEVDKTMSGRGDILIQPQIQGQVELIVGLIQDPQFGTCVMCGFGGILAEILDDIVFAVAPLSRLDAAEMLNRLKNAPLLDGFRGASPLERKDLADILVRLGNLGNAYPVIREIDINPLIVSDGKPIAVDASIRIAPS